jgi:hypothetical protein
MISSFPPDSSEKRMKFQAYHNSDKVFIAWKPAGFIPLCQEFHFSGNGMGSLKPSLGEALQVNNHTLFNKAAEDVRSKFALLTAKTEYQVTSFAKLTAPGKHAEGLAQVLRTPTNVCAQRSALTTLRIVPHENCEKKGNASWIKAHGPCF